MKRLIIVGSPRANGRSAHLAEMLFETNIDEHPEDELFLVPLSEVEVGPCIACDACREKMPVILKGNDGAEVTVERHRCIFDDDMQALYDIIDDADEITVVSPVYFSGAPAQLKCLFDRLQPYFWAHGGKYSKEKRPATLHVIGEGGDPHGFQPLVGEARSALAVAGFRLERVLDWVGKIDKDGQITAEAKEIRFDAEGNKQRPKLNLTSSDAAEGQPADKVERFAGNQGKSSEKPIEQRPKADHSERGAAKADGRSNRVAKPGGQPKRASWADGQPERGGAKTDGRPNRGAAKPSGQPKRGAGKQARGKSQKGKRRG